MTHKLFAAVCFPYAIHPFILSSTFTGYHTNLATSLSPPLVWCVVFIQTKCNWKTQRHRRRRHRRAVINLPFGWAPCSLMGRTNCYRPNAHKQPQRKKPTALNTLLIYAQRPLGRWDHIDPNQQEQGDEMYNVRNEVFGLFKPSKVCLLDHEHYTTTNSLILWCFFVVLSTNGKRFGFGNYLH